MKSKYCSIHEDHEICSGFNHPSVQVKVTFSYSQWSTATGSNSAWPKLQYSLFYQLSAKQFANCTTFKEPSC
jgi:hypothetical protein